MPPFPPPRRRLWHIACEPQGTALPPVCNCRARGLVCLSGTQLLREPLGKTPSPRVTSVLSHYLP